jgi:predicted 2-oxoglutarate/Fe(II)-dependent dioxygenase YbiX
MLRIVLSQPGSTAFDLWRQENAGLARLYWLNAETALTAGRELAPVVSACNASWRVVAATPPPVAFCGVPWLIDPRGDLARAVGVTGLAAVVVDAAVASAAGAAAAYADVKRRHDVRVDDAALFSDLREALVRRVPPAILQAFQIGIVQLELPRVGCHDAGSVGWFRRHRDNTTPFAADRQFAISLSLNSPQHHDGGQVRFPELGRQRYPPNAGAALVFFCSLLHEPVSVTRGRRFGAFAFLHDESHDVQKRRMLAEQQARSLGGVHIRGRTLAASPHPAGN